MLNQISSLEYLFIYYFGVAFYVTKSCYIIMFMLLFNILCYDIIYYASPLKKVRNEEKDKNKNHLFV